jgi:NADH:ubiquinone oxidoreductase subunit 5 (subunit L)/multisubunit Na+/H+ antiporter MnhA subunit
MIFSVIFIPLLNSLYLGWRYITYARQRMIFSLNYCSTNSSFQLILFILFNLKDALNPLLLQSLIKVYLSFWIVIINLVVGILFRNLWYSVELYIIEIVNVRLNTLCWFIVLVIILVSSSVILCSIDYLSIIDAYLFLVYISMFQFFMITFVLSNDIIIILFNWDWLGMISYLLINFWSSKTKSGIKAVVYNQVGDLSFLVLLAGSYSYLSFINYSPFLSVTMLVLKYKLFNYYFLLFDNYYVF